jgi:acetylornithine deacetylase/succinyl-diaminopimelate desuccinylase-like protein
MAAVAVLLMAGLPASTRAASASAEPSPLGRAEVQTALRFAREHHDLNIAKQIEISEVPASPFAEGRRAAFIAAEFRRIGLADVEIDGIGNVLGWRRGRSARTLVIAAHLDTVFPPGTDFTVKRVGTRLNGPGIQDDSRGLAVILGAVEAMNAGGIQTEASLLFVADVGEEGIGNLRGIKYLFNEGHYRDRLAAFISVDADGDRVIANREIGSRRYLVTLSGPGGHSWANFGRPNPANALGRIVARLADLEVPSDPATNRTSYNVGRIGGGTSVNSIPFEVWFEFDMRSVSEAEVIRLEQRFLAIVREGVAEENRFAAAHAKGIFAKGELTVATKLIGLRHAVAGPANAQLVEAAARAIRELGFGEPILSPSSTDSNAVASLGKPAITLGGGGVAANAHSLQEWFDPTDAYRGTQALIATVINYDAATARPPP